MDLYLLRHGIAEDFSADGRDASRALTPDGIAKLRTYGPMLARMAVAPTQILASPLVRAQQTAAIVAELLGQTHATEPLLGLDFDIDRLARLIAANRDAASLLLVGHEPGMSQTIGDLTGARAEMKKGALALVTLSSPAVMSGFLRWLLPPRALRS